MAITAHQGKFQRVTKLLRALHMIDLQFFPLVSSLKSQGGEATFFMTAHHHFTIKYMLVFTGDFFKCMKLIKSYIWNAEAFQLVQLTYLRWCLLTAAQAKYSITIWSHWNNRNETLKTKSVSVFIWKSSLWLYTLDQHRKRFSNPFPVFNEPTSTQNRSKDHSSLKPFPLEDSFATFESWRSF